MGQYTESFMDEAETLSPEDDDFSQKLLDVAARFRGFGESLAAFLSEHGYEGDPGDGEGLARFLRERFRAAGMNPPRDCGEWFAPGDAAHEKKISRETSFRICFALGLDAEETNDFFRRVQYERGIDCHDLREAVFYFCLRRGLPYERAGEILGRIPQAGKPRPVPESDVLYTAAIKERLDEIAGMGGVAEDNADGDSADADDSADVSRTDGGIAATDAGGDATNSVDAAAEEALVGFLTENIESFRYNNATAVRYIKELWSEISREGGLAEKEGEILSKYDRYESEGVTLKERPRSGEDCVVATQGASTWTVFSQIIGMSQDAANEYAERCNRSLSAILSDNTLLPLKASYCFPSQHGIDRILRGEPAGDEMVRKMLIFLEFYSYWAKMIIREGDEFFQVGKRDFDACLFAINGRLIGAGYPLLYAGNPYDWIFLWALHDDYPLPAFRSYMAEVFAVKSEQDGAGGMDGE